MASTGTAADEDDDDDDNAMMGRHKANYEQNGGAAISTQPFAH
jgi:hypothetical protein